MTDPAFQQLVTLIGIVGTGVGTVLLQIYRENRNHQWEKDERERVAAELAAKVKKEADAIQDERQRIARELADKVTAEATALAAKVAAEANYARAGRYHIQEAIEQVGVKADAAQEAIAQVGVKTDAAIEAGNHNAEKFDKVHVQLSALNTQLLKQGAEAAAAATVDKPPLEVIVVNTPLVVESHKRSVPKESA